MKFILPFFEVFPATFSGLDRPFHFLCYFEPEKVTVSPNSIVLTPFHNGPLGRTMSPTVCAYLMSKIIAFINTEKCSACRVREPPYLLVNDSDLMSISLPEPLPLPLPSPLPLPLASSMSHGKINKGLCKKANS